MLVFLSVVFESRPVLISQVCDNKVVILSYLIYLNIIIYTTSSSIFIWCFLASIGYKHVNSTQTITYLTFHKPVSLKPCELPFNETTLITNVNYFDKINSYLHRNLFKFRGLSPADNIPAIKTTTRSCGIPSNALMCRSY